MLPVSQKAANFSARTRMPTATLLQASLRGSDIARSLARQGRADLRASGRNINARQGLATRSQFQFQADLQAHARPISISGVRQREPGTFHGPAASKGVELRPSRTWAFQQV